VTAILVAAIAVPIASFATCQSALRTGDLDKTYPWSVILFGLSALAGLIAAMGVLDRRNRPFWGIALALNALNVLAAITGVVHMFSGSRGRQLRGPRGPVLPARGPAALPIVLPMRAARAWRNNGDTEVASVSAFSMLSLDLAQLGAPLALARAAHEDALDEIRHSELCYDLARRFGEGGEALAIAPMPDLAAVRGRPCTLASVAVESWIEGAYLETVSADLARELQNTADAAATRVVLQIIAADEARHAQHAWDVIAWCLQGDPVAVAPALHTAMERISVSAPRANEPGADGTLEPFGIPGRDRQRATAARCLLESRARLVRLLSPGVEVTA